MKSPAAALFAVSLAGVAQSAPPPNPAVVDLRQVLQQYHPGSPAPARELSAPERAELRRQLGSQPKPARSATPQRQGKR